MFRIDVGIVRDQRVGSLVFQMRLQQRIDLCFFTKKPRAKDRGFVRMSFQSICSLKFTRALNLAILCQLGEAPPDDHLLDLRGALINAENTNIAVETLNAVISNIACSAKNLNSAVGNAANHFRTIHFTGRCQQRDVFSGVALFRGVQHHATRRISFGVAICHHCLYQLMIGNRLLTWLPKSPTG